MVYRAVVAGAIGRYEVEGSGSRAVLAVEARRRRRAGVSVLVARLITFVVGDDADCAGASGESIPAGSQALMERYFTNVAADSGKASNVFGVLRRYNDRTGFADYRQTFDPRRQVIIARQPYPQRDPTACPYVSTYPTCISDPQIQSELQGKGTAEDGQSIDGREGDHELIAA